MVDMGHVVKRRSISRSKGLIPQFHVLPPCRASSEACGEGDSQDSHARELLLGLVGSSPVANQFSVIFGTLFWCSDDLFFKMSYLHLPDLAGLLFKHKTINTLTSGAPFFPAILPSGTLDPGCPSSAANPWPTSQSRGDGGVEKSVEVFWPGCRTENCPCNSTIFFHVCAVTKVSLKKLDPTRPTVFSIWHFQASVFLFIRKAILFLQMILKFGKHRK